MRHIPEIFTDALGRAEIKNIIGIPATIAGLAIGVLGLLGIVQTPPVLWSAYMTFATGLIVATSIADNNIDTTKKE